MKKFLYIPIVIILLLVISYFFVPSYLSTAANEDIIEIVVPKGASLQYVSNLLYDKDIIKSKLWFRYMAKVDGIDRSIKPGTYEISPYATLDEIFDMLQKGVPEKPVIMTIPEGFTICQIAQRVESLGFCSEEDFIQATKEYFKKKDYTFNTKDLYFEMEGYLYPDTYHFRSNQTPLQIVERLAKTMEEVFTEEYIKRAEELNLSIHEILTIASLIEREAYNDEERAKISGVIHNRLKRNMLLQIDASVIYGLNKGRGHITRVLYSDLEKPHPFNTYKNLGLPPGPIAAPNKASIEAALYPEKHDYLYYVLGENGHVFSKTYQEHLRNIAKYR